MFAHHLFLSIVGDRRWQAGGKNPVWNEEHAFEISSEKEAMIEVFDKENVGQDKFMGELKVLEVKTHPHLSLRLLNVTTLSGAEGIALVCVH